MPLLLGLGLLLSARYVDVQRLCHTQTQHFSAWHWVSLLPHPAPTLVVWAICRPCHAQRKHGLGCCCALRPAPTLVVGTWPSGLVEPLSRPAPTLVVLSRLDATLVVDRYRLPVVPCSNTCYRLRNMPSRPDPTIVNLALGLEVQRQHLLLGLGVNCQRLFCCNMVFGVGSCCCHALCQHLSFALQCLFRCDLRLGLLRLVASSANTCRLSMPLPLTWLVKASRHAPTLVC